MAMPTRASRLAALQDGRIAEIRELSERLKSKERSSYNQNIVQSRNETLRQIMYEARATHAELVGLDDPEAQVYIEERVFSKLTNVYEDTSDFLMTLLTEIEAANENTLRRNDPLASVSPQGSLSLKLPRLELPKFSGNYNDWECFRDHFKPLVHDVPNYPDASKLRLLEQCMSEKAAKIMKGVTPKKASYETIWNALNKRFTNPRFVVYSELQNLMDIPFLKNESAEQLRDFTDEAQRIVRVLGNLNMPVEQWDVWIVFILAARLDPVTKKCWETELSAKDLDTPLTADEETPLLRFPTFVDFSNFLEKRSRTLCMLDMNKKEEPKAASSSRPKTGSKRTHHVAFNSNDRSKCPLCSQNHPLRKCPQFNAKTPFERREEARRMKLCFNCLGTHRFNDCKSQGRCSVCQNKHHTLIHYTTQASQSQNSNNDAKPSENKDPKSNVNVHTACVSSRQHHSIILATAQLTLVGPNGQRTRARALLDQGSETSFISDAIANLLGLKKKDTCISLTGLGSTKVGTARFSTHFVIQSLIDPKFELEAEALILQRLTSKLPARRALDLDYNLFADLTLADPQFNKPDSIDLILGADVYGQLLLSGLKRLNSPSLIAQNTALGWIVSGSSRSRRAVSRSQSPVKVLHCVTNSDLNETLQQFWKLEELPTPKNMLSPDELKCEKLFSDTHTRDSHGRYVVPLKSNPPAIASETRAMAHASLSNTHRRLARDPELARDFRDFMSKYESLGHMERVPAGEINNPHAWYLPLHAVTHSNGSSRKLRVVFDAARQTRDKICLNDFLLPGPALQRDLSLILLNWRRYRYVFTADIVKMFRQIRVAKKDQDLQRILWSPSSSTPPVDYRLTTVTYGTNSAPFLSIRTLGQLAEDGKSSFPLGARSLQNDAYVDDIFTGSDDLAAAIQVREELVGLLKSAGIDLDKWAANHSDLLPQRSGSDRNAKSIELDESVKTLGIQWSQQQDAFIFTTLDYKDLVGASTKRTVLSNISRLFDPLGWLSPITVTAKVFMQDLWILKYDWDDTLPLEVRERWHEYCKSLSSLPSLSISRWLGAPSNTTPQIHGFCDASSRAYAAAVYIRIDEGNGHVRVSLLAAKTKVAPVKTKSIPNLELCGAVLLVKLLSHIRQLDFLQNLPVFAWSDSQIVLQWLKKHPSHWKTFIANRVSLIQTELPSAVWAHVPTKENPADLGTRGCSPSDLSENDLWWHGADWLAKTSDHWPKKTEPKQVLHAQPAPSEPESLSRFSDLNRMIRVMGYCLRPLNLVRRKKQGLDPLPKHLTPLEIENAKYGIIKWVQLIYFKREIDLLKANKPLPKRNSLRKLKPFVDRRDGVLRIGGRLANAMLTHKRKHPPILPRDSNVSRLFVRHAHKACLHGGPTLTSSVLIQRAWVLGRQRLVKTAIRNCVACQRAHPRLAHQLMGDLPALRTTPARPFSTSGVDYAGPFQVRAMKGRGHKSYKGYIAVFVCFSTRAIHLEVVDDLQSDTFISAFRRFVGRRGICSNLFSDNATTFQGADKELRTMFTAASEFYKTAAASLANDGTNWVFIPPNSPHYGGLWEAGVKSVKHHLKRAIGDRTFTFSELSTILVEIEACLNSRPLSPLSSDVEDLHALTPFHFLIGETSALIPDEEPADVPENRLDRLHLMQEVRNTFWKRWSGEYLQHLQERAKWRSPTENFAIGQLVIVRDDRLPPAKWPLGRITQIYHGPDGIVRVVDVRTATSSLRRHIVRLCPLSLEPEPKK